MTQLADVRTTDVFPLLTSASVRDKILEVVYEPTEEDLALLEPEDCDIILERFGERLSRYQELATAIDEKIEALMDQHSRVTGIADRLHELCNYVRHARGGVVTPQNW